MGFLDFIRRLKYELSGALVVRNTDYTQYFITQVSIKRGGEWPYVNMPMVTCVRSL